MPNGSEETKLENWEAFSKNKNWNEEIQSILYVANFVHEFVHLIQHTTLLQCMHQVDFHHSITKSILGKVEEFKGDKSTGLQAYLSWIGQRKLIMKQQKKYLNYGR